MTNTDTASQAAPEAATQAAPQTDSSRPDWLPQKFHSPADLAKAYAQLERAQASKQAATNNEPSSLAIDEAVPQTHDAAQEMVATAGLDFDALTAEYAENGSLSAQSYEDLGRAGIAKNVVDGYIQGQTAIANEIRSSVFSRVEGLNGLKGADAYADLVAWAASGLDQPDIDAFNGQMNSGNRHQMALAVDALKARYVAANGSPANLINGHSGQSSFSGDVFTSRAEMTEAMKDPRYASDPAYRNGVIAKLGRSDIL